MLTILLGLVSCSDDFLQEKRDFTGMNEQVFQDSAVAKSYVDYIYHLFRPAGAAPVVSLATMNNGFYNVQLMQTTDEFPGQTKWNREWAQISPQQNHALEYIGKPLQAGKVENATYSRLRQINMFINNIDDYGMEEGVRNRLKGEMYFWRAFQYYDLLRFYGGVPLALEVENPVIGSGDEGSQLQRSSSSETMAQIVSDFDQAIELLPGRWPDQDWGRVTSGAAAAMKGRALLNWASPQFNPNDDASRWQQAYDANLEARDILEQNGFGLYREGNLEGGEAWFNMFLQEVGNPEAVFVHGYNDLNQDNVSKNNAWENNARSTATGGGAWIPPTKNIVDAFPMKDGKMPGESSNYEYDLQTFYKDRDPRFYQTFVFNGSDWPFAEDPDFTQWTYRWYGSEEDENPGNATEADRPANSGIYLRKMTNPESSNSNAYSLSGLDFMELRFAEVVLNLAESAIGIGNLTEGKQGIMEIRERAGVENLDGEYGLADLTERDELFGAIIRERKVEFAYEGKRYDDLRRWLLFNDDFGTVSRLGLEPMNGTRRTGFYIVALDENGDEYVGDTDPFVGDEENPAPVIDRDPETYPEGITTEEEYLDYLYENYFEIRVRDDLDPTDSDWTFQWYNEYYYFGFYQRVMETAPYLEQTEGWGGSFDPLQ